MNQLSIVVPCYNEAENIPLLLERFDTCITTENIQVVLVNNGSTDNSAEILEDLLPKYSFAKMVNVSVNQGYGYGILQGLKASDSAYIGWTHADLQTDPSDILKTYQILEKNKWKDSLFIKGNRKGRPFRDEFFTIGMSCYEFLILHKFLKDINAQPTIFPKSFFMTWKNPPFDFSLDLYAFYLAKQKKLTIIRFPVRFPERIHGESKWNTSSEEKKKFIKRTTEFSKKLKKEGIQ